MYDIGKHSTIIQIDTCYMCKMDCPETPLWDYLDFCEIPFRESRRELISRYGKRNCGWTDDLEYCEVSSRKRILKNLAHPLVFQFYPNDDLEIIPTSFSAYIREYGNYRRNYKSAIKQLRKIFGAGSPDNSSNTIAEIWQFGEASIRVTAFPPRLNNHLGINSRHDKIDRSNVECSIAMETGYCPLLTNREKKWLDSYEVFHRSGAIDPPSLYNWKRQSTRTLDEPDTNNMNSFGFDKDRQAFIIFKRSRFVDILPLSWVTRLVLTNMTRAKGSGSAFLSLYFYSSGNPTVRQSFLTILDRPGQPFSLNEISEKLSDEIKMPLEIIEYPDC